ncbi:unnamed protein product [Penicillium olsonii]|nr:unnamed protein product [Penicillium olsonii]
MRMTSKKMGRNPFIVAFAPIRFITAGGYLAVSYLQSRESTGDIDCLIDPEFVGDKDIITPFEEAVQVVAKKLDYNPEWMNDAMSIFVIQKTRKLLFEQADQQDIILYKGENLEIRAAPIEWALERKLRRIHAVYRNNKGAMDISDAVAMLKHMRTRNDGPMDGEVVRKMNMNGFDVEPDRETMNRVADEYRRKYGEEIFK